MYRVLFTIAAINAQSQFPSQPIDQFLVDNLLQIDQQTQKLTNESGIIYVASNKGFDSSIVEEVINKPSEENDIISQLKKEEEAKDKALMPDLESLGLDPVDDNSNNFLSSSSLPDISNSNSKKTIKSKGSQSFLQSSPVKPDESATTNETKQNLSQDKKSNPPSLPPTDKSSISLPPLETLPAAPLSTKESASNQNSKEENIIKDNSKKDAPKDNKTAVITEEIVNKDNTDKPVADSLEIGKSTNNIQNNISENVSNQTIPKIENMVLPVENMVLPEKEISLVDKAKMIADEKKKKAALIAKKRRERIALIELKQRNKIKKLKELKQKYLQEENDDYETYTSRYQSISKINPPKKILPQFVNGNDIPPPLLNRFKGQENRHHPMIMSNSEKIDFMFKAISENRIDEFNSLLNLVGDPNIKNSAGDTLLTFALLMGRHDAISSLLSKGANPELANNLNYTPLNIAIEMVDYESVSLLINMGAKTDFIDELGRTYLMQSSRVGSLSIVDLLIRSGVDINYADNNGVTALAIAYKHKKDIIAKYLLKYGAKSFIKKDYIEDDTSMIQDLSNKWK